jgi:hypothetical protein
LLRIINGTAATSASIGKIGFNFFLDFDGFRNCALCIEAIGDL